LTSGRSSAPSIEIDESASGGRISTRAFECRWSATEEEGLRSSRSRVERMRTTYVEPNVQLVGLTSTY
jgi:hypothetical protein